MMLNELYGMGHDYNKHYIRKIKAVTLEEITRAARRIMGPKKYVFVTLGP
jgi:predicted Zn-dependent peptidase